MKRIIRVVLLGLALIVANGCGLPGGHGPAEARPSVKPDRVLIEIDQPSLDPASRKQAVVLSVAAQVQQLYATTLALPPMPKDIMCTMEVGPHYTLTFQQGGKTLTTVIAKHEGCRPVSIAGEKQERQANQQFWSQLDQAIQKPTA